MPTDIGNQQVHIKFFDPVTNPNANFLALDLRKTGIYSGGYITKATDTAIDISPLCVEIADKNLTGNQVRITTHKVTGTVRMSPTTTSTWPTTGTPLIVLRWTYTGSSTADYMEFLAIAPGTQYTTDVIVGMCIYDGGVMRAFPAANDYLYRSNPNILDLILKVEPTWPASLNCRIRAGHVTYGASNLEVMDTLITLTPPPSGVNPRIALVQIDANKTPYITYGAQSVAPQVAPPYNGLFSLAEITLAVGQTTITELSIRDVRTFVNAGTPLTTDGSKLTNLPGILAGAGVIPAANLPPVGPWGLIPALSGNALKYLRVNATGTAFEYVAPVYQ